jgi:hypothetical protein
VNRLHDEAKAMCVLRASVNFPVNVEPVTTLPGANLN